MVVENSSMEPHCEWVSADRRPGCSLDRPCGGRVASETYVSRYFDEKSGNEAFSNDIDHNAKQIACSSGDDVW